jgi:hypothetical protein
MDQPLTSKVVSRKRKLPESQEPQVASVLQVAAIPQVASVLQVATVPPPAKRVRVQKAKTKGGLVPSNSMVHVQTINQVHANKPPKSIKQLKAVVEEEKDIIPEISSDTIAEIRLRTNKHRANCKLCNTAVFVSSKDVWECTDPKCRYRVLYKPPREIDVSTYDADADY